MINSILPKIKIPKIEFYLLVFFLGFILKPFYLLPSGSAQIGDLLMFISFVLMFLKNRAVLSFIKIDKSLLFFISCVSFINGLYYLHYQYKGFIINTIYLIFNIIVIFILRKNHHNVSLKLLSSCCKFNIIVQLLIYLTNYGRWLGAYRYQGTFNDPNQFAFAVFSWYLIIYCIEIIRNPKIVYSFYALTFYLVYKSNSMGMTMGMTFLILADLILGFSKIKSTSKKISYFLFMLLALLSIGLFSSFLYTSWDSGELNDIEMFRRLKRKTIKYKQGWIYSFIRDRNLENVIFYPEVMLYGSGGGYMGRYSIDGDTRELHSTWIALLFYYGIIPFLLLINWIRNNLKSINKIFYAPIFALIIESFTLVNFRQPTFWILFLLVGYCSKAILNKYSKNEKESIIIN